MRKVQPKYTMATLMAVAAVLIATLAGPAAAQQAGPFAIEGTVVLGDFPSTQWAPGSMEGTASGVWGRTLLTREEMAASLHNLAVVGPPSGCSTGRAYGGLSIDQGPSDVELGWVRVGATLLIGFEDHYPTAVAELSVPRANEDGNGDGVTNEEDVIGACLGLSRAIDVTADIVGVGWIHQDN